MKKDPIARYLAKHADLESRPLVSARTEGVEQVVVIPALAEGDYLPRTLAALAANPASDLGGTLVICVVNNGPPASCDPGVIQDNRETLQTLDDLIGGRATASVDARLAGVLRLAYVDAATPGNELPAGQGVGLARKIGLDWGVEVLRADGSRLPLLFSLDADTVVEPNYLSAVRDHFEATDARAAVIDYAHLLDTDAETVAAIVCYELFLRYHVLGLRYAGSPYAFHTIGSTIVCSPDAYAAVSGMSRRQGGEDFYFLQKIAKTYRIDTVTSTCVHPSPRPSERVPFGTGPRVRRFLQGAQNEYRLYHPDCYRILGEWLELAARSVAETGTRVLEAARQRCEPLGTFLEGCSFAPTWDALRRNAENDATLRRQFHRWFDGLKTLRLIHHLERSGYPQQDMFEAIADLVRMSGLPAFDRVPASLHTDMAQQIALLCHLRERGFDQNQSPDGR